MSLVPYAMTLRALDAERRRCAPAAAAALVFLGSWLGWALGAEVTVCVGSTSATLVAAGGTVVLAAPEDGVLASRSLWIGRRVSAGEVVAALDRRELAARWAALAGRRDALVAEVAAVSAEMAAAGRALAAERGAATASDGELRLRVGAAADAARLAAEVAEREARLAAAGVLARAAAERSGAEAAERLRVKEEEEQQAAAGERRGRAALADRGGAGARLAAELARLRGDLAAVAGERAEVEHEMERRLVRAPAPGRLVEVTAARPGAPVARGAALATLVPNGGLEVMARFAPDAGAEVRPGQRAWARLPAGIGVAAPATRLAAAVTAVTPVLGPAAGAAGGWEVRLALAGDAAARWPLARPGVPCEVEVAVARATPARLAMGGLGVSVGRGGADGLRARRDGAR
jgi:multidrug resistance efflux pump